MFNAFIFRLIHDLMSKKNIQYKEDCVGVSTRFYIIEHREVNDEIKS